MLCGVSSEGVRRALFQFRCLGHSVSQTSTELPPWLQWKGIGTLFLSWERAALGKTILSLGEAFSSVEKVRFKLQVELTSMGLRSEQLCRVLHADRPHAGD